MCDQSNGDTASNMDRLLKITSATKPRPGQYLKNAAFIVYEINYN